MLFGDFDLSIHKNHAYFDQNTPDNFISAFANHVNSAQEVQGTFD